MADWLPGINVGAGWRRLTGDKSRGDEDILPWISKDGGARDFNARWTSPTTFSFQGDVKDGWVDNGKGGLSQVAKTTNTPTDDTPSYNTGGGGTGGGVQRDPAYAAFMQKQAQDTAEAQGLRDSILGRRGEIESILNAILGNIDTELGEAKGRRTGQFDRDVDSLVGALDTAIPDIQNAFAAMGLSNSTYKGDRVQDTRDSFGKSYEDTNRQLNEDLTGFQRNAAGKKAEANTNASKMFGALDEVKGMKADADNLGRLKEFNSQSRNALTDFSGEKSKFMPGGDALRAISALDSDYDFGKTLDTFNTFASEKASPGGNGVGGGKAKTGQVYEDDKKKNKTEVQVNNPVGAASA